MTSDFFDKYGHGQLILAECRICGWVKFRCLHLSKPDEIILEPISGTESCDRCRDVYNRAPEVVGWVLNVVAMHSKITTGI